MKTKLPLLTIALALGILGPLYGEPDLALDWKNLVYEARDEAGVALPKIHTGIFEGVHTMNPKVRFTQGKEGDAAHAMYVAAAKVFRRWTEKSKARSSTTQGSDGEMMLRIRATNGDYVGLTYRPPVGDASQGTFSVIFVDASQFIEGDALPTVETAKTGTSGRTDAP